MRNILKATYNTLMIFLLSLSIASASDLFSSPLDQKGGNDSAKTTDIFAEEDDYETPLEAMRINQNFYWLVEGVIAGMAQPEKNSQTLRNLKTLGIGTVISLNGFRSDSLGENDINHISYDLEDPILIPNPLIDAEKYARFTQLLKEMITATARTFSEKPSKAVVIHCQYGTSRTGALLAAWLQIHHKETIEEIIEEPYRQICNPIQKLKKSAHPRLFIMLKKEKDLLGELLALRHPKAIALAKDQLNSEVKYANKESKHEKPTPKGLGDADDETSCAKQPLILPLESYTEGDLTYKEGPCNRFMSLKISPSQNSANNSSKATIKPKSFMGCLRNCFKKKHNKIDSTDHD